MSRAAVVILLTAPTLGAQAMAPSGAEALAERLLQAVGGRAAWAGVTSLVNDSWQHRLDAPTTVRTVITLDLTRPRFRIETWAERLHLVRVVDSTTGWRVNRAGMVEDLPGSTLSADLRWHQGHVYRTLHRLARRDPSLRVGIGEDGRLEVYEGPTRIAWYRLDQRGEPFAFGGVDDDVGTVSGPWRYERHGVRHPIWVSRPDGSWRSDLVSLEVNWALDDRAFARPER